VFVQTTCVEIAGTRLVIRVQRFIFAALLEQEIGYFDATKTGELTTILTTNAESMMLVFAVVVSQHFCSGTRRVHKSIGFLSQRLSNVHGCASLPPREQLETNSGVLRFGLRTSPCAPVQSVLDC
jgi:hypothetical protein